MIRAASTLLYLLVFGLSLTAQLRRFTISRPAMGTPWQLTLYTTDSLAARQLAERVFARVEAVEQSMSDYRSDSEINQLVRLPPRRYHRVSEDLYRVLDVSLQLARRSGGAFDPTVGPLSKLWRRAIRHQAFPTQDQLAEARTRVQWKSVRLRSGSRVRLARDGLQLDLGGIAKGYALDASGEVLRQLGCGRFLIDGGGDLLLGDAPPGRDGWRIATPAGPVDTSRVAVATSGSNYRYVAFEGQHFGHIVDPRTGLGVTHQRTVTVMAPTAVVADGLASTLSVLTGGQSKLLRSYPRARLLTKPASR